MFEHRSLRERIEAMSTDELEAALRKTARADTARVASRPDLVTDDHGETLEVVLTSLNALQAASQLLADDLLRMLVFLAVVKGTLQADVRRGYRLVDPQSPMYHGVAESAEVHLQQHWGPYRAVLLASHTPIGCEVRLTLSSGDQPANGVDIETALMDELGNEHTVGHAVTSATGEVVLTLPRATTAVVSARLQDGAPLGTFVLHLAGSTT